MPGPQLLFYFVEYGVSLIPKPFLCAFFLCWSDCCCRSLGFTTPHGWIPKRKSPVYLISAKELADHQESQSDALALRVQWQGSGAGRADPVSIIPAARKSPEMPLLQPTPKEDYQREGVAQDCGVVRLFGPP